MQQIYMVFMYIYHFTFYNNSISILLNNLNLTAISRVFINMAAIIRRVQICFKNAPTGITSSQIEVPRGLRKAISASETLSKLGKVASTALADSAATQRVKDLQPKEQRKGPYGMKKSLAQKRPCRRHTRRTRRRAVFRACGRPQRRC